MELNGILSLQNREIPKNWNCGICQEVNPETLRKCAMCTRPKIPPWLRIENTPVDLGMFVRKLVPKIVKAPSSKKQDVVPDGAEELEPEAEEAVKEKEEVGVEKEVGVDGDEESVKEDHPAKEGEVAEVEEVEEVYEVGIVTRMDTLKRTVTILVPSENLKDIGDRVVTSDDLSSWRLEPEPKEFYERFKHFGWCADCHNAYRIINGPLTDMDRIKRDAKRQRLLKLEEAIASKRLMKEDWKKLDSTVNVLECNEYIKVRLEEAAKIRLDLEDVQLWCPFCGWVPQY